MAEPAVELVASILDSLLLNAGGSDQAVDARALAAALPLLEGTLQAAQSYRDGAIIQIASGLTADGQHFDHRQRAPGGRGIAKSLGSLMRKRHIPAVTDAFQNIGKNVDNLARGNVAHFDSLLLWANAASAGDRRAALTFLLAKAASTARSIRPLPRILTARLTFAATLKVLRDILAEGSGGAMEQYSVAAIMEALLGEWSIGGMRVQTKRLNASDASSGTAGDVEILTLGRVDEAFEVSANDWRTKIDQAADVARGRGLDRAHVVAHATAGDIISSLDVLEQAGGDVSVLDIRSLLMTGVAILRKPGRERFLMRLHEYLAHMVADVGPANRLVAVLEANALVEIPDVAP